MSTLTLTLTERQLRALAYQAGRRPLVDDGTGQLARQVTAAEIAQERLSAAVRPDEDEYLAALQTAAADPALEAVLGAYALTTDPDERAAVAGVLRQAATDAQAAFAKTLQARATLPDPQFINGG